MPLSDDLHSEFSSDTWSEQEVTKPNVSQNTREATAELWQHVRLKVREAAGKYSRHLSDDVTVRTGGRGLVVSHGVFLDARSELLGVGIQTALHLEEEVEHFHQKQKVSPSKGFLASDWLKPNSPPCPDRRRRRARPRPHPERAD